MYLRVNFSHKVHKMHCGIKSTPISVTKICIIKYYHVPLVENESIVCLYVNTPFGDGVTRHLNTRMY